MAISKEDMIGLSQTYGVPPELTLAVWGKESSSSSDASLTSVSGARGPMQVMPGTFYQMMGPNADINDETQLAIAGIKYLKQGLNATGGNLSDAAKFYHSGPAFKQKIEQNPDLADPLGTRTVDYANDVVARAQKIKATLPSPSSTGTEMESAQEDATESGEEGQPLLLTDPRVLEMNLQDALKRSQEVQSDYDSNFEQLKKDHQQTIQDLTDSITKQAKASADLVLLKAKEETQAGTEAAATLSRLGWNTSDANSEVAQSAIRILENKQRVNELRQQINDQAEPFNPFNPIGSIINSLQLSPLIQEHNMLIDTIAEDVRYKDQATGFAQATNEVNKAKYGVNAQAKAQAVVDEIYAKAQADVAKTKLEGLKLDSSLANQELLRTNQQVSLLETATRLIESNQLKADAAQSKKMKDDLAAAQLKQYQLAAAKIGVNLVSLDEYNKLPAKKKAALAQIITSDGKSFGATPADSLEVLRQGNPNIMPQDVQAQYQSLVAAEAEAKKAIAADPMLRELPVSKLDEEVNKRINSTYYDLQKATDKKLASGVANPYSAPPIGVMLGDPEFRKTKFAGFIQDVLKATPTYPTTDESIIALAYEGLRSGKFSSVEEISKDLNTYFKRAMFQNNTTMKFSQYGLPDQTSYGFAGTDWSKPASVTKYFVRKESAELAERAYNVGAGLISGAPEAQLGQ